MADYPEPLEADPDSVVTALEVGASMWSRGEQAEAMKWLRKAVDEAFEAGLDERGLELSKSAAAIASLVPPAPSAKPSATSTAAPPATVTAMPSPNAGTVPPPVVHAPAPVVSPAPPPAASVAPPVASPAPPVASPAPPPVANPAPPPVASDPPPVAPSPETASMKPVATSAAPAPRELREPEPVAAAPADEAPAKRLSVPLPPPVPRTAPPRPITGRNRSSRPPAGLRTATARPPLRSARGDDSSRPAPKAPTEAPASPSEALVAEAARLAVEDVSTRVTVPSDAPSKIDVMAAHDAAEKRAEEPRDEVIDRPRFDRKFLTPLAMPRTATPPRPLTVPHAKEAPPVSAPEPPRVEDRSTEEHTLEGLVLAVTPSVPPLTEPPEGATRPALPDDAPGPHERPFAHRAQWTTTGAVRVAVSREGGRVTVRAYDGGALHDGEVEALLVATPDVERLFRMLEVDGTRGA